MPDITPFQGEQAYPIPPANYNLPAAPTYTPPAQTLSGANPYASATGDLGSLSGAYQQYLGRYAQPGELEKYWGQSAPLQGKLASIQQSPEANLYGRASSEINPLINAQEQDIYNQIGTARQATQSQLGALSNDYASQFGGLAFGKQQQTDALDALRASIMQDTGYNAGQLQSKFQPAYQNAINMANRRGLLDSTVSLGLINQGYQPIQQALGNLYQTSQRNLTDAEQKKQTILEKYGFDYQNLVSKREQEAKGLQDQLALLTQQKQNEAGTLESTRAAKVYARTGELGDTRFQQNLSQSQLNAYIQNLQAAQALEQQKLAEQQRQFNLTPGHK